ncbi:calcium/sodium antiporter [uncultured Dubosiella sp.]|uniref:calcium/sodium antiporter n=2 Tax=uncultured Dubosiella sp. TaxID=1937011 RepID=UPI0025B467E0|nr:calcium/sodium antiporter [uncultured Dubosiella sp.]
MAYIVLLIGMALLIKGADLFVDGSASIAYQFHIPTFIVGLTIVALGTSLPELSVSVTASLAGSNELALSNVIGSNIFNTLVVVGCSALMRPFLIDRQIVKRDLLWNILITFVLLLAVFNHRLNWINGVCFLVLLTVYIVSLVRDTKAHEPKENNEDDEAKIMPVPKSVALICVGVAGIILGGNLVVDNATWIAQTWGMSETLVGLTIVSVGTSLPELITSMVAAKKGESGLSLGNAIGSNIMNITFILGVASLSSTIQVTTLNLIDIVILCVIAVFLYFMTMRSEKMSRARGLLMLCAYIVYAIYIVWR